MYTRENFEYWWGSWFGSHSEYSLYSILTNALKQARQIQRDDCDEVYDEDGCNHDDCFSPVQRLDERSEASNNNKNTLATPFCCYSYWPSYTTQLNCIILSDATAVTSMERVYWFMMNDEHNSTCPAKKVLLLWNETDHSLTCNQIFLGFINLHDSQKELPNMDTKRSKLASTEFHSPTSFFFNLLWYTATSQSRWWCNSNIVGLHVSPHSTPLSKPPPVER